MNEKNKIVGIAAVILLLVVPFIIWMKAGFTAVVTYLFVLFTIPGAFFTIQDVMKMIQSRNFRSNRMIKVVLVLFLVAFIIAMSMFPSTKNVAGLGLIGLPFLLWWQPER